MSLKKQLEHLENKLGLSGGDWWKDKAKLGPWRGKDLRELPIEELRAYRAYIVTLMGQESVSKER